MRSGPPGERRPAARRRRRRRRWHARALERIIGAPPLARVHTLAGDVRRHRGLVSAHASHARDIVVYLPPDYDASPRRRYPVLYMHDGQNIFDSATAFNGVEWQVDETAERLIAAGAIEPLIVVGIYNTPARVREYTHVKDPIQGGGAADSYARFLVGELKPLIDGTYRTRPEPRHTGTAGSSLGGLVALYLGLAYSRHFARIGVLSPAVWWGGGDIVERIKSAPRSRSRIWLDVGTAEGDSPTFARSLVKSVRATRDALIDRGWRLGEDLLYMEDKGAGHNERAWGSRMERVLKHLFPPPRSAAARRAAPKRAR